MSENEELPYEAGIPASEPVEALTHVGEKRVDALREMGYETVGDCRNEHATNFMTGDGLIGQVIAAKIYNEAAEAEDA